MFPVRVAMDDGRPAAGAGADIGADADADAEPEA
jgi:hypothetical protein